MRLVVAINDRCTINRDGRRPMVRSIDRCILRPIVRANVASCNRSYEHSWYPVTERTINRDTRSPMQRSISRSIVASCDRSYDQSLRPTTDRTINRGIKRFGSQVRSFEHDHRPCYGCFCFGDHPRYMRPVVRYFYDLPTIPTIFGRR